MTTGSPTYYGIFNDSFPPIIDGVTLTVLNYASHLRDRGRMPVVVTPHNPEKYETPWAQMRYFSLPIWNRRPYRYGYPKLDLKIWQRLRHTRFALVHSHSPFSAGRLAAYAARKQRVPLIGTFHSKYRTDLEHSFKHFPWMTQLVMSRIRSFFEACDEIWIPQARVEDTVREYGIRGKVILMENGSDFVDSVSDSMLAGYRRDARHALGMAPDTLALLFVGQHIREKGIMMIADALALLKGKIKFHMDYIGNGYATEELRRHISSHELDAYVTLHGSVKDRETLARHYAAANLFLFPSFYDNAPLVVREAAAFGTPSVLLQGSTAAEVITHGRNGFLADNTPESIAELIEHLAAEPHTITSTGIGARASLASRWDDVIDRVLERYDRIIADYKK